MERLTQRNSVGIAVYKQPYECERCNEPIYRLPDYGNGSPTDKLAELEDLAEQGRLLIPRFKRGDKVYILSPMTGRISEYIINVICVEEEIGYSVRLNRGFYFADSFFESQIGKTVFITEEEAEAALEKMKGEEHE